MGVSQNGWANQGTTATNNMDAEIREYGVNKFKASFSMFIPEHDMYRLSNGVSSPDQSWLPVTVTSEDGYGRLDVTGSRHKEFPQQFGWVADDRPPEVTFRRVTVTRPKIEVKKVAETVAVKAPLCQPLRYFVSHLEFKSPRRYKNQIDVYPTLSPEKYSETCYVYINNTRKRYVSTTFLKPRLQSCSCAETVYSCPKTTFARFETVLTISDFGACKDRWFKTHIELQPKPNPSTRVSIPLSPPEIHQQNGLSFCRHSGDVGPGRRSLPSCKRQELNGTHRINDLDLLHDISDTPFPSDSILITTKVSSIQTSKVEKKKQSKQPADHIHQR